MDKKGEQKVERVIKKIESDFSDEELEYFLKQFLERCIYRFPLSAREDMFIVHDDCDGDLDQALHVGTDAMGDMYIKTNHPSLISALRFRTFSGGGRRVYTYLTLRLLWYAIKLDKENLD